MLDFIIFCSPFPPMEIVIIEKGALFTILGPQTHLGSVVECLENSEHYYSQMCKLSQYYYTQKDLYNVIW